MTKAFIALFKIINIKNLNSGPKQKKSVSLRKKFSATSMAALKSEQDEDFGAKVRLRERGERESVCVCACVCVWEWEIVRLREEERMCGCVCECARERDKRKGERDREYKRFSETSLKRFSEAMAIWAQIWFSLRGDFFSFFQFRLYSCKPIFTKVFRKLYKNNLSFLKKVLINPYSFPRISSYGFSVNFFKNRAYFFLTVLPFCRKIAEKG